jgi:catechol 1,2-dioxygenase
VTAAEELAKKNVQQAFAAIDFDFHLYADSMAAPTAEVERVRASA